MNDREKHDALLANKPPGVEHEEASCPFCSSVDSSIAPGGEMKTYTQEELDAAVIAAIKPVQESLDELKAGKEQSEVEARFAEERAELDNQIKDIQAQLDSAVLQASEAEKKFDELVEALEEAKAADEAKAEADARMDARLARVNEVASFPEEYITANAERWASLSDEDFEALVADWSAIAKPKEEASESTEEFPQKTAMVASRNGGGKSESAVRELFDLTLHGVDPRTVF